MVSINNWDDAEELFKDTFNKMRETEQEKEWHAEGNVLNHTKMVYNELIKHNEFKESSDMDKLIMSLSCILHDIGKIVTTKLEGGQLVSPGHARVGSEMARSILWKDLGLCGKDGMLIREAICGLIKLHTFPVHAIDDSDGKLKLLKASANCVLTPYFNIDKLCLLSEVDVRGRIYNGQNDLIDSIELCRELAKEIGCLYSGIEFKSSFTEYAYLSGKDMSIDYELYDNTWGEVILMSGLPGTGKDTWIRNHYSHLPMISLDEIRKELKIKPTDNQGAVIVKARERAKELLRKKQPFVWNATNITQLTRQKLVDLFINYGTSVRIVYLETELQEQLRRNSNRDAIVPEKVIYNMLENLTPPERYEAHKVEWYSI